ncbi:UNVERIFIED_CONTAM: Senp7 [Trichonephila clavipes]
MREKKGQKSFLPMKIFSMSVPQQPNSCDCGLYLLENFQCFFQKPIENFGDPMPDLKDWYHQACIFKKRQDILRIIFDLTQE